jgi:SAM-dependent methyltransferase
MSMSKPASMTRLQAKREVARHRAATQLRAVARSLAPLLIAWCTAAPAPAAAEAEAVYTQRPPSEYGIGKVYMGREISHVMGHLGAGWLERPEREREEQPEVLIKSLSLASTDVVADIGAGSGYFSFRLAERVPDGRVLAVDIQPEMLDIIERRKKARSVPNVQPVLGTITDPRLPEGEVDLALMFDAYHEFSHPREMMEALYRALRPGGRVALVEYRAEDPDVPILATHKMTEAQARKEMESVGLRFVETLGALPQQHLMIFAKPEATPPAD